MLLAVIAPSTHEAPFDDVPTGPAGGAVVVSEGAAVLGVLEFAAEAANAAELVG